MCTNPNKSKKKIYFWKVCPFKSCASATKKVIIKRTNDKWKTWYNKITVVFSWEKTHIRTWRHAPFLLYYRNNLSNMYDTTEILQIVVIFCALPCICRPWELVYMRIMYACQVCRCFHNDQMIIMEKRVYKSLHMWRLYHIWEIR